VPPESVTLAKAFLAHYNQRNLVDLKVAGERINRNREKVEFIGDDQECRFWPADAREVRHIDQEDRVILPDKEIAQAWGEAAVQP